MSSDSSARPTNRPGRSRPAAGVLPAHQGLEAEDPAVGQRGQRLVLEAQLAVLHGGAQVVLELEAAAHLFAQAGVEDGHASAPPRLGLEHGHVGVLEDVGGLAPHVGQAHEPDARGHRQRAPGAQLHGPRQDRCAAPRPAASAASVSGTPGSRAANSSPCSRLRLIDVGAWRSRRRWATARSTSSPTAWPRESFTSLKRSRSKKNMTSAVSVSASLFSMALLHGGQEAAAVGERR